MALARVAAAEGVCVQIDVTKDNLSDADRNGFRVAILEALRSEGIQIDPDGVACRGVVIAYSMKLGKSVTTTIYAGNKSVSGKASSLDELDLSVRQLVRSLVTGGSLATGFGVTDRQNVLRDQTAPRRVNARDARRWDPVLAIGGGMLQLPALDDRPRQRQTNIIAIEGREWGFLSSDSAGIELYARILIHDYSAMGAVKGHYDEARSNSEDKPDLGDMGSGMGLMFSPFLCANYEGGFGLVNFIGNSPPRPFVRVGGTTSVLLRVSDPDHRIDLGLGGYAGFGFQLAKNVNLSIALNVSSPVIHSLARSGYSYWMTTTAMIEFRGEGKERSKRNLDLFGPEDDIPTIRRINE
jgi:hypothetical protein